MYTLRDFKPVRSDFFNFIELFYRIKLSYCLNVPSEKYVVNPEYKIPDFSTYCLMINKHIYTYKALCDNSGKIVGAISYTLHKNRCVIHLFFVDRKFQLSGVGRKFYLIFEQFLKNNTIEYVELTSFTPGSMEFWKKMGFEEYATDEFMKNI